MSFQKDTCFFSSLHHCNRAECWSWFPLFIWFVDQMQTPGPFLRRNNIYSPAPWRALFSGPGCSLHVGWCDCRLCLCSPWLWSALGSCKEKHHGIQSLKAEPLSPHIWEQDWWWVCFIACMSYTERLSPAPIQHDHTELCPYHTCTPHIAAPLLQCEMSWVRST